MNTLKLAIVGLGVLVGTAVFAQDDKERLTKEERMEKRMDKFSEELELTDQQKMEFIALHKEKKELHKKLKDDASLDEAAKKTAIKEFRKEQKAKMAEILTDEQELKLKEMKKEGAHKGKGDFAEKLDLTDQQKVQVEALHQEKKAAHKKLKEDANMDEAAKKAVMKQLRADQKAKMAEILTDEQMAKMKEMKKDRHEKHKKGKNGKQKEMKKVKQVPAERLEKTPVNK
ncbi:hypothetical protein [Brumimicrobium mesophilum]|uniref:hypothetical protein n=1 Tax=Brumimicrobium mesophilum TaxID=392717 RepID=UPI000D140A39|nr:hypothetical protein [Brumimicrobium mesophilum]